MPCHNCQYEVQDDWKVCPSCKISLEKEKCSTCNRELEIEWEVCPFCPQQKNSTEGHLVECVEISCFGIYPDGTFNPEWDENMNGSSGYLSIEKVNQILDELINLHPFVAKGDIELTFAIKPKSGVGELALSFGNERVSVEDETDKKKSTTKGVSYIKDYIEANKLPVKSSELLHLELKKDTFKLKQEIYVASSEPEPEPDFESAQPMEQSVETVNSHDSENCGNCLQPIEKTKNACKYCGASVCTKCAIKQRLVWVIPFIFFFPLLVLVPFMSVSCASGSSSESCRATKEEARKDWWSENKWALFVIFLIAMFLLKGLQSSAR